MKLSPKVQLIISLIWTIIILIGYTIIVGSMIIRSYPWYWIAMFSLGFIVIIWILRLILEGFKELKQ